MIIHLLKSKLFTIDPAIRFANEYDVDVRLWNDVWRRHTLLGYSNSELCEFIHFKTGRKPKASSIRRWVIRTEIYCLANHAVRMGVRVVQSEYFGKFEQAVLDELMKNMRFSAKQDSRSLV